MSCDFFPSRQRKTQSVDITATPDLPKIASFIDRKMSTGRTSLNFEEIRSFFKLLMS